MRYGIECVACLLSDLLPVLIGRHSGKLLEVPAEVALVAHAYQLME